MAFKDSIKKLRLEKNLSKVEMAKRLNVSEGTVRMWENGNNEPRMGAVEKVAATFNVSKGFLLGLEETEIPFKSSDEVDIDFYGNVSAGNFEHVPVDIGTLKVPSSVFKGRKPGNCLGLQVNGDSMNKILSNGSYIIVHDYRLNQDFTISNNDILVFRIGNEYTVKRVRKTETKLHLDPHSFSDEFLTNTFELNELENLEVIGKVIYNYQLFE